ncbi:hypothetical protein [Kocuria sp. U4B]
MSVPTAGFDVRAYMRDPHVLRPEQLNLEAMGALSDPALEALTYLWAVEGSILGRIRDVLVTPTHAESRVTAFLSTWSYEQHRLTETLRAVLTANGRTPEAPADTALGRVRRTWDDRARPTIDAIGTNLLGAEVTGAHMVTGWLDTAVLTVAYRRLGEIEPALEALTESIGCMKARHLAFYAEEAHTRLARSATAVRIARAAVARWRLPGTRYIGLAPARAVAGLLNGPAGRPAVEQIGRTVLTDLFSKACH